MKKYILLGDVFGIGGWQLYGDARITYLTEKGIEPYFLCCYQKEEDIKLAALKSCAKMSRFEFLRAPNMQDRRKVQRVLEQVKAFVDCRPGDEVFVESTSITLSLWGEMIAQALHGTHFAYLLQSHIENVPQAQLAYFDFKYSQQLLGGMSTKTLPDLFQGHREIEPGREFGIPATWKSPLCESGEYDDMLAQLRGCVGEEGKIIGYFGVLDKPHFALLCDYIGQYAGRHPECRFAFLSVGSSKDGSAEKRQLAVQSAHCVCVNIPQLYPVPRQVFRAMDVCISSFGSSMVSFRSGAPTLRLLNDVEIRPHGVMGITLKTAPYVECPPCEESLDELMDNMLFLNAYSEADCQPPPPQKDYHLSHAYEDSVMRLYEPHEHGDAYYDVRNMPCASRYERCVRFLNHFMGIQAAEKLLERVVRAKQRLMKRGQ